MPVVKLGDLANVMIKHLAPIYGHKSKDIQIDTIGIRNGEKMYEHQINEEEVRYAYEIKDMFIVIPQSIFLDYFLEGSSKAEQKRYESNNANVLCPKEVKQLLNRSHQIKTVVGMWNQ